MNIMDFFNPENFDVLILVLIIWLPALLMGKIVPLLGVCIGIIIMGLLITFSDPIFAVPFLFVIANSAVIMWKGVK